MLYLNLNDPHDLKFDLKSSYFCKEVTDNAKVTFRTILMQRFVDSFKEVQKQIANNKVDYAAATAQLETLWQQYGNAGETNPPLVGVSAEPTPSASAFVAATRPRLRRTFKPKP